MQQQQQQQHQQQQRLQQLENRICRQIQDLHVTLWHKREKEAQRLFAKLHIPSLLQGVEIELIFALPCVYGPQFLRYWLIFLNVHIWA